MNKPALLTLAVASLALAACSTTQERAGGAGVGAVAGAAVAGPVGAVAGGVFGAATGPTVARETGVSEPRRTTKRKRVVRTRSAN